MRAKGEKQIAAGSKSTIFKIVHDDYFCILVSNDFHFLENKIKILQQYTKSVDPLSPEAEIEIDSTEECKRSLIHDFAEEGYTHFTVLNGHFPRLVEALYGQHRRKAATSNCHGTALFGAGILPVLSDPDNPRQLLKEKAHNILVENIRPGDLIYSPGHSFIYLDEDICLSMNGRGKLIKIYTTNSVMNMCEPEILPSRILIFRKNEDWFIPEPIITALLEFYEFSDRFYQLPGDPFYYRIAPIATVLQEPYLEAKNAKDEEYYKYLYEHAIQPMPRDAIPPLQKTSESSKPSVYKENKTVFFEGAEKTEVEKIEKEEKPIKPDEPGCTIF